LTAFAARVGTNGIVREIPGDAETFVLAAPQSFEHTSA
jgi:hypothetical protein